MSDKERERRDSIFLVHDAAPKGNWIPKFHFEAMQMSHLLEELIANIHKTYIALHQFLVLVL